MCMILQGIVRNILFYIYVGAGEGKGDLRDEESQGCGLVLLQSLENLGRILGICFELLLVIYCTVLILVLYFLFVYFWPLDSVYMYMLSGLFIG